MTELALSVYIGLEDGHLKQPMTEKMGVYKGVTGAVLANGISQNPS